MADKSKAGFMDIITANSILKKLDSGKYVDVEKDLIEKMLSIKNEEKRVEILLNRSFLNKITWYLEDDKFLKRVIKSISDIDLRVKAILGLNNDKAFEFLIELDNDQIKIDLLKRFSDKSPSFYFNYDRLFNSISSNKEKISLLFGNLNLAKFIWNSQIVDLIRTLDDYNERFNYLCILIHKSNNNQNITAFINEIINYVKEGKLDASKLFDEGILMFFNSESLAKLYVFLPDYESKEKFFKDSDICYKISLGDHNQRSIVIDFIKESNNEDLIAKLINYFDLTNIDEIILEKGNDKLKCAYIKGIKNNCNSYDTILSLIDSMQDEKLKAEMINDFITSFNLNIYNIDKLTEIILSIKNGELRDELISNKSFIYIILNRQFNSLSQFHSGNKIYDTDNDYTIFKNLISALTSNEAKIKIMNFILEYKDRDDFYKFNLLNIVFNSINDDDIKSNFIEKNACLHKKAYVYLLGSFKDLRLLEAGEEHKPKIDIIKKYFRNMINANDIPFIFPTDKMKIEVLFNKELQSLLSYNINDSIQVLLAIKNEQDRYNAFFNSFIIEHFIENKNTEKIIEIINSFKDNELKMKALSSEVLTTSSIYDNQFVSAAIQAIVDDELKTDLLLNDKLLNYLDKEQIIGIWNSFKDENKKRSLLQEHPLIFQKDNSIIEKEGAKENKQINDLKIEVDSNNFIHVIQFLNDEIYHFIYNGQKMEVIRYNVNLPDFRKRGLNKETLLDEFRKNDLYYFSQVYLYYTEGCASDIKTEPGEISEKNIEFSDILSYIAENGLAYMAHYGFDELYKIGHLNAKKFDSPKISFDKKLPEENPDLPTEKGKTIQNYIDELKELEKIGLTLSDDDKELIAKYDGTNIAFKLSKEDINKLEAFRNRTTKWRSSLKESSDTETPKKKNKLVETKKSKRDNKIFDEIAKNKQKLESINLVINKINKQLEENEKQLNEKFDQIALAEKMLEKLNSGKIDRPYLEQLEEMKKNIQLIKDEIAKLNKKIIFLKDKQEEIATVVQSGNDFENAMKQFDGVITDNFERDTEMNPDIRDWYKTFYSEEEEKSKKRK